MLKQGLVTKLPRLFPTPPLVFPLVAPLPCASAFKAKPLPAVSNLDIGAAKRMTLSAMSSGHRDCSASRRRDAASDVFGRRYWLQMGRPHTGVRATKVVDVQPGRNATAHQFINGAMGRTINAPDAEAPVTIPVSRTLPYPTRRAKALVNFAVAAKPWRQIGDRCIAHKAGRP